MIPPAMPRLADATNGRDTPSKLLSDDRPDRRDDRIATVGCVSFDKPLAVGQLCASGGGILQSPLGTARDANGIGGVCVKVLHRARGWRIRTSFGAPDAKTTPLHDYFAA